MSGRCVLTLSCFGWVFCFFLGDVKAGGGTLLANSSF